MRRLLPLFLAAALAAAAAGARDVVERDADDLLVLDLRLDGHLLVEGFVGYLSADGVLLPLAEVAAALDLPIEVDAGRGVAEGWFLSESRRFSLDAGRGEVFVEGRPARFDGDRIERHRDGLYVDASLLGAWLPVDFEVDLSRLQVVARPREELPLQQRMERRRGWKRLERTAPAAAPRTPAEPLRYRLLDWPAVDHQVRLTWRRGEDGGTAGRAVYDALAAGDLMGMNAELAYSSAEEAPRLRLERKDPQGRLAGPLGATEVAFGDVWLPAQPLTAGERLGRGFVISSFPLDRPHEFDRTTLTGSVLPGWEVELYRNEDLIAFQTPGSDGRYEFTDVPLLYGYNHFRLVFHGPHGERREKVERFVVGPGLIRGGESHYRVAAQRGGDLEGWRSSAELEHGVRTGRGALSLTGRLASLPVAGRRRTYASAGVAGMARGLFGRLELAADMDGGWAGRALLRTRIRGWHLFLEEHRFAGFVSEATGDDDPLVERGTVRLETRFDRGAAPSLGLRMAGRWSRHASGRRDAELAAGLSRRIGRFSVSKAVRIARSGELAETAVGGSLLASTRARRLGLRADVGYRVAPRLALTDAAVTADWRLDRDRSLRLGLHHDFVRSPATRLDASLSWRFERFAVSLGAALEEGGRARAHLTLSSSFGRDPLSGRYRASGRSLASQGAVAARAFLDHDLDGRYGAGDEPLPGVTFQAGGRSARGETGGDGTALLAGLPVHDRIDVGLAFGGLEDPSWITRRTGTAFVLRPGRVASFEVPVAVSGEVDGTVYLRRGEGEEPASKVRLELLGPEGERRYETESVFDGFYLFAPVLPGRYVLRVDPEQASRLGLEVPPPRQIVVEPGQIVSGLDLVLEPY